MKTMKIISILLVFAAICCSLIACEDTGNTGDITLPERDFYEVTVSFQIKSADGKTQIEALDYKYKGHAEPTILTVVKSYLTVVAEWTCKIDKSNTITQIGGMKTKSGDYFGFVKCKKNASGEITMSALNLSLEQIKKNLNDGNMNDTVLTNGDEFAIILIQSED